MCVKMARLIMPVLTLLIMPVHIRRALCVCVVVGWRWCMGWLEGGTCVCGYMLHVVGVPGY